MFGPSDVYVQQEFIHHRMEGFHQLLRDTETKFKQTFGLDQDEWIVLFVTGSGTLANEIVLDSLIPELRIRSKGQFSRRLRLLASERTKVGIGSRMAVADAYVAYETGESRFIHAPGKEGERSLLFCDMISAFPYYMPDESVDVWTTVTSKQLRCEPGLSLIVLRKHCLRYFRPARPSNSTLSLASYAHYRNWEETPHTPVIQLIDNLRYELDSRTRDKPRYYEDMIDNRRMKLVEAIGEENVIGEGPVATLKPIEDQFAKQKSLYCSPHGWQIFLYARLSVVGTIEFEWLVKELKSLYKDKGVGV